MFTPIAALAYNLSFKMLELEFIIGIGIVESGKHFV
jgi:hypothetical protein